MPKIARWGTRAPGYFSSVAAGDEENARTGAWLAPALEGIEMLDGTLYVRVAGPTFDRLRWVDEGEQAGLRDKDLVPKLDV